MKNNQILLLGDNDNLINKAKKVGINTFIFPLEKFSVGFKKTYKLSEIKEDAFIYINKNLENADIDYLKSMFSNLNDNIKGVIFEDLGLINILKESKLVKIYDCAHLNCSYESVKAMLKYVDTVILSTDITEDEMKVIMEKAIKKVSLYTFGLNRLMYSRRLLLTNYAKEYNLKKEKEKSVHEKVTKQNFRVVENEFGTVFYSEKFYDALKLFAYDNIAYYIVNMAFLPESDQDILLNNFKNSSYKTNGIDSLVSSYFLTEETYYKLPPKEEEK